MGCDGMWSNCPGRGRREWVDSVSQGGGAHTAGRVVSWFRKQRAQGLTAAVGQKGVLSAWSWGEVAPGLQGEGCQGGVRGGGGALGGAGVTEAGEGEGQRGWGRARGRVEESKAHNNKGLKCQTWRNGVFMLESHRRALGGRRRAQESSGRRRTSEGPCCTGHENVLQPPEET